MERLPERHIERRRETEAVIEGKVERSFTEIDIGQAQPIPLHDITWPTARLTFQEVRRYSVPAGPFGMEIPVQLYTAQLEYQGRKGEDRRANLSDTTSKDKPVLFSGTTNGFYAYDPLVKGLNHPFYVVGIQPEELEENMRRMSAVYHELGHVLLCHTNVDTQLLKAALTLKPEDLPQVAKAKAYGRELANAIPTSLRNQNPPATRRTLFEIGARTYAIDRAVSLFHERNAWAAGMHVVRANGYPTGFERENSYFDYARLCLKSYARSYRDNRFVQGWNWK